MSSRERIRAWEARNWSAGGSFPHRLLYVEAGRGILRLRVPSRKGLTVQSVLLVGAPLWYAVGLPYVVITALALSGYERLTGLMLDLFLLVVWPLGAVLIGYAAWRWGTAYAMRESSQVFDVTEVRNVSIGKVEQNMTIIANGVEMELTLTARPKNFKRALSLSGHPVD